MHNAKRHSIVDIGYWTCDIDANARAIHDLVVEKHEPNKDFDLPIGNLTMDLRQNITTAACQLLGRPYYIDAIWGVYTAPGQSVMAHSHWSNTWLNPEEHFSFCYYPLCQEDDADMVIHIMYCNRLEKLESIPLRPGLLVIFGAYYQHMTTRQFPDRDRVSIAGNLYPYESTGIPIRREMRQGVTSDDLWQ
ncbi:MAG: hypothetical protein CL489_01025 [Acidobacteria bacterium]|nr:hypothetical protein [Acidobacteriota bacterium]